MTDIAASLGIEQLKRLDQLNNIRKEVTDGYTAALSKHSKYLQLPKTPDNCFHSFYGYPITVKEGASFTRADIVRFLEKYNIETRAFMGGDLSVQPAYRGENTRTYGTLTNTKLITDNSFFIGCHPHIDQTRRDYVLSVFEKFFKEKKLA
jgi:CDP-6-deoxy-D-xylo-4-hexulose-3-dehydrase